MRSQYCREIPLVKKRPGHPRSQNNNRAYFEQFVGLCYVGLYSQAVGSAHTYNRVSCQRASTRWSYGSEELQLQRELYPPTSAVQVQAKRGSGWRSKLHTGGEKKAELHASTHVSLSYNEHVVGGIRFEMWLCSSPMTVCARLSSTSRLCVFLLRFLQMHFRSQPLRGSLQSFGPTSAGSDEPRRLALLTVVSMLKQTSDLASCENPSRKHPQLFQHGVKNMQLKIWTLGFA